MKYKNEHPDYTLDERKAIEYDRAIALLEQHGMRSSYSLLADIGHIINDIITLRKRIHEIESKISSVEIRQQSPL